MANGFCPYCGAPYPKEGARFCSKCGRESGPVRVDSRREDPRREPRPVRDDYRRDNYRREPRPVRRPRKGLSALFSILAFMALILLLLTQSIRQGLSDDRVRSAVGDMDIAALPLGGLIPGAPDGTTMSEGLEKMFEDLPTQVRAYYDLDSSSIEEALSTNKVREWFARQTVNYVNALLYDEGDGRITGNDILNLFNTIGDKLGIPNLGDDYINLSDADKESLKDYYVENSFSDFELRLIHLLFAPWFAVLLCILAGLFLILAIVFACGRFLRSFIAPGIVFLLSGILTIAAAIISAMVVPDAVGALAASAGESVSVAAKHLLGGIGFYGVLYGGISILAGVLCIILFVVSGRRSRD